MNKKSHVTSTCPLCGQSINVEAAQRVRSARDVSLDHIECPSCNGGVVLLTITKHGMITAIGLATDMQKPELERFISEAGILEDDIIAIHEAISTRSLIENLKARK
ncbi:MAG: hypothetical protein ABIG66_04670 [Candidatus Kerfeldbacteria bacterium]